MRVRVLGPTAVMVNDGTVGIEAPKHRALLVTLALRAGEIASTSELIDALWGDDPPATAAKTLQTYVSALRSQFDDELIDTVPGGYRLAPSVEQVDAIEFQHAVLQGREFLEQANPEAARRSRMCWRTTSTAPRR